jgi:MATE family multidrug resistance protein
MGWVFMGFFDNLMVGEVGYVPLAAAGITNSVLFLTSIFGMGILMVVPTLISAKRHLSARHTLRSLQQESMWLSQILSLLTLIILLMVYFNFDTLQQEAAVVEEAKPYYLLVALSTFPSMWFMSGKNICDGYEKTKIPMIITLVALGLNILLNWIFIFGHGVEPMGLYGAGVATLISRMFMAVSISIYMHKNTALIGNNYPSLSILPFRKWLHLKEILALGVPSGLQYFFEVAAFAFAAIMAGWIGARELAAHQIGITLSSVTYMLALGISTSASIIIGNALSKNNLDKIKKAGITALLLIAAIMAVFGCLFLIFRYELAFAFSTDTSVISITATLLLIASAYQIFDGVQAVALGVLRGMRDVKKPLYLTLFSYWVMSIPLAYLLAFRYEMGVIGIWIGLTFGLISSSLLLSLRFMYLTKNK